MGYTAGLYVIPAAKFAAAQQKGTWSRHRWDKCRPWFFLSKSWYEFNKVLTQKPAPVCYAIDGIVRPNPDEFDFVFVPPEVVPEIASALDAIPIKGVLDAIERSRGESWKEAERGPIRQDYATSFEDLRTAYRTAAATGSAVGILIC